MQTARSTARSSNSAFEVRLARAPIACERHDPTAGNDLYRRRSDRAATGHPEQSRETYCRRASEGPLLSRSCRSRLRSSASRMIIAAQVHTAPRTDHQLGGSSKMSGSATAVKIATSAEIVSTTMTIVRCLRGVMKAMLASLTTPASVGSSACRKRSFSVCASEMPSMVRHKRQPLPSFGRRFWCTCD